MMRVNGEDGGMSFSQVNGIHSSFHTVKRMLVVIDDEYREMHREVVDYFMKDHKFPLCKFDKVIYDAMKTEHKITHKITPQGFVIPM